MPLKFFIAPSFFFLIFLAFSKTSSAEVFTTGGEDQTRVEITVYGNNLGLVKDVRRLSLPRGEGELRFQEVASSILPVTVHVKPLAAESTFRVLEQNYEYDLISPSKLLDKFVGQKIKLLDENQYQDRKEWKEALLLSNNGEPVFQIGGEIYLGHPGLRVLPEVPENLIAKPTLSWLYTNNTSDPQEIEVRYLTHNLRWNADYVLVLDADDHKADLSGWVSLENQSGATYTRAKLKLIAGTLNQVTEDQAFYAPQTKVALMAGTASQEFEEKKFFEYHIYDLGRETTIKDQQTKQIRLLEASSVTVKKEFRISGEPYFYNQLYSPEDPKIPVEVFLLLDNTEGNHLGIPLPEGTVRLYKEDAEGSLQFIGEDRIPHTAKDEKVRLKAGEAFDVAAEKVQTDFRQITSRLYESAWEIKIRNHKEESIPVTIRESLPPNWEILDTSHPYEKRDAHAVQFDVTVPKDAEAKLTYRIRAGY